MQSFDIDENGWATGAITPLAIDESITLLSPEVSSRVDAARWAHQAEVFFRARLTVVQDKRYPSGAHPLADRVEVEIDMGAAPLEQQMSLSPGLRAAKGRGLGSPEAAWRPGRGRIATVPEEPHPIDISQSGAAPTRVQLITVPVDRAPFAVAAGAAAARAIGGAGFDALVARARRIWQARATVAAGGDPRAPLAAAAVLASLLLAPVIPRGGGAIFGVKGARQRLESDGWKT